MPEMRKVTVEEVKEGINKNIGFLTNVVHLYTYGLEVLKPFVNKPITQRIATAYKAAHPDHNVYLSHKHGLWYLHLRLPGQQFNDGLRMFLGYYPTNKVLTEGQWSDLERAMQVNVMSIKNHEHSLLFLDTWVEKHNFAIRILADLKKNMTTYGVQGFLPSGHLHFKDDYQKGGDTGATHAR